MWGHMRVSRALRGAARGVRRSSRNERLAGMRLSAAEMQIILGDHELGRSISGICWKGRWEASGTLTSAMSGRTRRRCRSRRER